MIMDSLSQHARYVSLWPKLEGAFRFLHAAAKPSLAEGRHEIDGERMFALCARYRTRDYESAQPESHRRYVDVQYLVSGRETIYWTPLAEVASPTAPYDPERDILFYSRNDRSRAIDLAAGNFVIFFPEDAHEPNCHFGAASEVQKVVVKVLL